MGRTVSTLVRASELCLLGLKTGWLIIGLTLLLALAVEGAARAVLSFIADGKGDKVDARAKADGYAGADWTEDYFREFSESTLVEWKPYIYWRKKPYKGKYINIDTEGIRRTWNSVSGGKGDSRKPIRIFMFGGSTLWGTGARDDYTIPSLIAKHLASRDLKVEVVNLGETGYVSTQEVVALLLELQKGNIPDIAVFYDGINDIYTAYQSNVAGVPHNELHRRREFNLLHLSRRSDLRRAFYRVQISELATLRLERKLATLMQARTKEKAGSSSTGRLSGTSAILARGVVEVYLANVRIVEALGKVFGFKVLFYWQPVIFTKNTLTPYERDQLHWGMDVADLCRAVYHMIEDYDSKGINPSFHDIADIFADTPKPYFIDPYHVTEAGNDMIAKRMVANILKLANTRHLAASSS